MTQGWECPKCGRVWGAEVRRDGYARMLVSVDVDQRILVSNDWPRASTPVLQEQT